MNSIPKPNAFTAMEMRALNMVLSASLEHAQGELADMFRIAQERLQQIQAYLLCAPTVLTLPELKALMTLSSTHVMGLARCPEDGSCDCKAIAHDASVGVQKLCAAMAPELKAAGITVYTGTRAEFEAMQARAEVPSAEFAEPINAHAAPGRVQ